MAKGNKIEQAQAPITEQAQAVVNAWLPEGCTETTVAPTLHAGKGRPMDATIAAYLTGALALPVGKGFTTPIGKVEAAQAMSLRKKLATTHVVTNGKTGCTIYRLRSDEDGEVLGIINKLVALKYGESEVISVNSGELAAIKIRLSVKAENYNPAKNFWTFQKSEVGMVVSKFDNKEMAEARQTEIDAQPETQVNAN